MDDTTKQQVPGRTNERVLQTSSRCYSKTQRLKGAHSYSQAGILLVRSFESGLPIVLSLQFLAFTNPTRLAYVQFSPASCVSDEFPPTKTSIKGRRPAFNMFVPLSCL